MQAHNLPPTYIIGLGSQALAWAQNLQDSGVDFTVLLRSLDSKSSERCHKHNFQCGLLSDHKPQVSSIYLLLIPDSEHKNFLEQYSDKISKGSMIVYAHGQSLSSLGLDKLFPDFHHSLLAPKSIASEVRKRYLSNAPLGAAYSVITSQRHTEEFEPHNATLTLAKMIGINQGPFPTSFKSETHADLLSEQGLLCSTIPYMAKLCFEKLISQGIDEEVAYMECWVELQLITQALCQLGPQKFFEMISPAALIGSEKAQKLLFDQEFQSKLDKLYTEIEDGTFNRELEQQCSPEALEDLRQKVTSRWVGSPLTKTHLKYGQNFFPSEIRS